MNMETSSWAILAALLLVTAQLHLGLAFSSVAPAFLWSPHLNGKKVDYRTLASKDLAKSMMTEGGWSKYLCSSEDMQGSKNIAVLFIGSELKSLEVSRPSKTDPALTDLLKDSFSNSNSSLAFPYVVSGEEKVSIENSLISEFAETCQHNLGISSITSVGSCSMDGEKFDKINHVDSVNDYLNSRTEKFSSGHHIDLLVLCPNSDQSNSESNIISQLFNTLNEMGAKYTFVYISDPFRSADYFPKPRGIERFLAEGTVGNGSTSSGTCDEVCQIKSSLLEGLLVGLVLLIILISGLCCMMGIDTPTRFETPEAS